MRAAAIRSMPRMRAHDDSAATPTVSRQAPIHLRVIGTRDRAPLPAKRTAAARHATCLQSRRVRAAQDERQRRVARTIRRTESIPGGEGRTNGVRANRAGTSGAGNRRAAEKLRTHSSKIAVCVERRFFIDVQFWRVTVRTRCTREGAQQCFTIADLSATRRAKSSRNHGQQHLGRANRRQSAE
ncbi:hypothetical protein HDG35_004771 [Paraburkholderia sp. JPY681]|nr:hypothetical protein [Paraburkholderia atlantica]